MRAGGASYYEFVVDAADHDVLLSLTPQRGRFAPSLSASFTVVRPNASAPDSFSTTPRSWAGGGGGTGGGEAGVVELLAQAFVPDPRMPQGLYYYYCYHY